MLRIVTNSRKFTTMKKKILIPIILIIALLLGAIVWLFIDRDKQQQEKQQMVELAEMDKKEMENQYEQFAMQYSEMKTQINNDSIIAQLTQEQEKTQRLLQELRQTKSTDAREIARLKKELATVRSVLRSYVIEIDSLNRLNQNLTAENTRIKGKYEEANKQIAGLNTEKKSLSEKVAIAAQLDAVGIDLTGLDKRNKPTKKIKKTKALQVSFTLAKNVTAQSGNKVVYVRVNTPTGTLLGGAGTFAYENRSLECSMKRSVEYGGKETPVTLYCEVTESLQAGTYRVSVFADGNMIGSKNFVLQ